MLFKDKIVSIGKNKVLLYVISRYLTYGIQFVNSIFIAVALGPEYLAVWGFINLILQYIAQLNFGIPYSLNVLLSINKEDKQKVMSLFSTSLFLYILLSVIVIILFLSLHLLGIKVGEKYYFDTYMYIVVAIALIMHFNSLFTNYFRVYNRLWEIVFFQSVLPLSMLLAIISAKGKELLVLILWLMLIGQIVTLLIYIKNSHLNIHKPTRSLIKIVLGKGMFLFIYNACFYFIMLSTRTLVSTDYQVKEFGFFTFSFTLANTIMLLFDSFSFLIYPKTINRLYKAEKNEVLRILGLIRSNYITSVHLVMYVFLLLFPSVIKLFPQYNTVFKSFALMAMTVILYSNCFAFSSFLTARGKEKILSVLAFAALLMNVLLAVFISRFLMLSYEYVIIATMFSYGVYNLLLSFFSFKIINVSTSFSSLCKENFIPRLFIPFTLTLMMVVLDVSWLGYFVILLLFVIINRKQLNQIKDTIVRIVHNPMIINI